MKGKRVAVSKPTPVRAMRVCAFCNLMLGEGERAIAAGGAWVHGGGVGENCFRRLQPVIADMVIAFLGRYCIGLQKDRIRLGQARGRARFYDMMHEVITANLAGARFTIADVRYNRQKLMAIADASLCDISGLGVPMIAAVDGESLN